MGKLEMQNVPGQSPLISNCILPIEIPFHHIDTSSSYSSTNFLIHKFKLFIENIFIFHGRIIVTIYLFFSNLLFSQYDEMILQTILKIFPSKAQSFLRRIYSKNSNEAARGYQRASGKPHKWRGKKKKRERKERRRKRRGKKRKVVHSRDTLHRTGPVHYYFYLINDPDYQDSAQPCLLLSEGRGGERGGKNIAAPH